jgi:hypothetical protein
MSTYPVTRLVTEGMRANVGGHHAAAVWLTGDSTLALLTANLVDRELHARQVRSCVIDVGRDGSYEAQASGGPGASILCGVCLAAAITILVECGLIVLCACGSCKTCINNEGLVRDGVGRSRFIKICISEAQGGALVGAWQAEGVAREWREPPGAQFAGDDALQEARHLADGLMEVLGVC